MSAYDHLHGFSAESSQIVRYVYFRSLARAEQDLIPLKAKAAPFGELGHGFYDALRGIFNAAKERDQTSLFMKLYRQGVPKDIEVLSDKFKQEAYRPTTDEYERGFLIAWEIALKILAELKEKYPEYPLKDEPQPQEKKLEEDSDFEVKPRKKVRKA